MPRPIQPGADPKPFIETLRKTITVRSKDRKTFHTAVGTADMTPEQLADNVDAILKRLVTKLERGSMNIGSVYVKTTMGPSARVI
jgi:large subunit ribosomal protein L1